MDQPMTPFAERGEALERALRRVGLYESAREAARRPLLPGPDNFTPPSRTPWGGTKILSRFKTGLAISREKAAYPVVGESWEISADKTFPSRFRMAGGDRGFELTLPQLGDLFGRELFGTETFWPPSGADRGGDGNSPRQCPILVKLLDAADNLSVQVHPDDAYEGLAPDECGKPESWFVVDREPGAGLYLGLREGVTAASLRAALEKGTDISDRLNFVPVEPGDFFLIGAGTIHAIGAGVTLVEPQRISAARTGVTYRFWDWNRRYNEQGELDDDDGLARPLHVEDSFAVTRFDDPRGPDFVRSIRPEPVDVAREGGGVESRLARTEHLGVHRIDLARGAELTGDASSGFHGLTVVSGAVEIRKGDAGATTVRYGASAVVPAAFGRYTLAAREESLVIKVYDPTGG